MGVTTACASPVTVDKAGHLPLLATPERFARFEMAARILGLPERKVCSAAAVTPEAHGNPTIWALASISIHFHFPTTATMVGWQEQAAQSAAMLPTPGLLAPAFQPTTTSMLFMGVPIGAMPLDRAEQVASSAAIPEAIG